MSGDAARKSARATIAGEFGGASAAPLDSGMAGREALIPLLGGADIGVAGGIPIAEALFGFGQLFPNRHTFGIEALFLALLEFDFGSEPSRGSLKVALVKQPFVIAHRF